MTLVEALIVGVIIGIFLVIGLNMRHQAILQQELIGTQTITSGSPRHQRIERAIEHMRAHGAAQEADRIAATLKGGRLFISPMLAAVDPEARALALVWQSAPVYGKHREGDILLPPRMVEVPAIQPWPPYAEDYSHHQMDECSLTYLAATLVHESYHQAHPWGAHEDPAYDREGRFWRAVYDDKATEGWRKEFAKAYVWDALPEPVARRYFPK